MSYRIMTEAEAAAADIAIRSAAGLRFETAGVIRGGRVTLTPAPQRVACANTWPSKPPVHAGPLCRFWFTYSDGSWPNCGHDSCMAVAHEGASS